MKRVFNFFAKLPLTKNRKMHGDEKSARILIGVSNNKLGVNILTFLIVIKEETM